MEEGSSIVKAVEKAWTRAGKPQEFSVKVFEESKRNFFGFTSRSAKIAIFFDERKTQQSSPTRKEHTRDSAAPMRTSSERPGDMRDRNPRYERPERADRHDRSERSDRYDNNDRPRDARREQSHRSQQRPERPERQRTERQERPTHHAERHSDHRSDQRHADRNERSERPANVEQPVERMHERAKAPEQRPVHQAPESQPVREQATRPTVQETKPAPQEVADNTVPDHAPTNAVPNRWTPQMVQFAQGWMNHVFSQAGYDHAIALTVSEDSLFFTLPKTVMTDKEKEQALFRNCSHLIMAALRNSFDNDFRDMKVIITSS